VRLELAQLLDELLPQEEGMTLRIPDTGGQLAPSDNPGA
jgi:hypothetical protein